ncbi:glycoside hydrolase family 16 protein [Moniliophthora roreri MCA 2997]|uniref:Glycoside hydrolase family 16 protein n=1 Tax=Moniliophthora roreri (strain MCA 2997) TaxID=1381753 RepID=V2WVF3_MONRO|nr:glycoside hydrolase family 16 protein [Moniliophthora roreri MCA 2997]
MTFWFLFALLSFSSPSFGYDLVRDYSGPTFFDGWDFFGNWDNLTLGDVWWLNEADAFTQQLAYVNAAGNAILKVDNRSNVPFNEKRNTVRLESKDTYALGSLWIIDLRHIPYGCSVWPAFWTVGPTWPDDGEIDIIEGINMMGYNQIALHSLPGCFKSDPPTQLGRTLVHDCSTPSGCTVQELQPNSFGPGFAAAGGGVWATQFDVSGIYMWFWSRPNVPASIIQSDTSSSIDLSQWGSPTASYPSNSCDITRFFSPQKLVLDITLCGVWAGEPKNYLPMCADQGPTKTCYADNVVGPGSPRYDNAYFEISYVRAYTTGGATPTSTRPGPVFVTGGSSTAMSNAGQSLSIGIGSQGTGGYYFAYWIMSAVAVSFATLSFDGSYSNWFMVDW